MPEVNCTNPTRYEEATIRRALRVLEKRLRQPGEALQSPERVRDYLRLLLAGLDREVFLLIFLDAQHCVISTDEMFLGTLAHAPVYPREVARRALVLNADAVILAHNHPSGNPDPSVADYRVTCHLRDALALVGIRILDHFIIAGASYYSFREHGFPLSDRVVAPPPMEQKRRRGRKVANTSGGRVAPWRRHSGRV